MQLCVYPDIAHNGAIHHALCMHCSVMCSLLIVQACRSEAQSQAGWSCMKERLLMDLQVSFQYSLNRLTYTGIVKLKLKTSNLHNTSHVNAKSTIHATRQLNILNILNECTPLMSSHCEEQSTEVY